MFVHSHLFTDPKKDEYNKLIDDFISLNRTKQILYSNLKILNSLRILK
jgi:hypothetical protein